MLECFDKERVCNSQDHVWSREREREEAETGLGQAVFEQGARTWTYGACVRVVSSLNSLS